jgi:toxin ParE1/3/4
LADYRLSRLARLDPFEIADYTLETWGEEQAYRYLDDLDACLKRLAESPGTGRPCDHLRPGYRRLEHEKHVIFYRTETEDIFIVGILHERMMPRPYLLDDPHSK